MTVRDVSELTVGDWVRDHNGRVHQVESVDNDTGEVLVNTFWYSGDTGEYVNPLTDSDKRKYIRPASDESVTEFQKAKLVHMFNRTKFSNLPLDRLRMMEHAMKGAV